MPRKKAAQADAVPAFDPYATLDADIDLIAKKVGLTAMSVSEKEDRFDTGNLCLNLMTAGGFLGGGWYTFFGKEQSCKTTLATNVLGSIIRQKDFLGRAFFYDYEGSFNADYANNMWQYSTNGRANNVEDVFGKKDKAGNWIVRPRIQYFAPAVGEDFFDALSQLLKKLPSVMLLDGTYWYIYPNTKANQSLLKGKYDSAYFKKFNKFRVPAPHGLPQAVIIVDSYPSMLPRNQDAKEDGSDGLASQARMFSEGLKRVKGRMREKRVLVFGINQLRDIPMAMHGPKEQEACGNALRFYCMAGDTYVFTEKGMLTAREYHADSLPKLLGEYGLEKPTQFDTQGRSQLVKVSTELGNFIKGKPGHMVYNIASGGFRPSWTALQDISYLKDNWIPVKIGANVWAKTPQKIDFTYVSKAGNETVDCVLPTHTSVSLAKLCGLLVSEGTILDGRVIFVNSEQDVFDNYCALMEELFELSPALIQAKTKVHKNTYVLDITSTKIAAFLSHLGLNYKSRQKRVPYIIRTGTQAEVFAFLSAYMEGDGSIDKKSITYTTRSPQLATELQMLLLNAGILVRNKLRHDSYYKQKHLSAIWHCTLYGKNARLFTDEIGFIGAKRKLAARRFYRGESNNDVWTTDLLPDLRFRDDRNMIVFNSMLEDYFLQNRKHFRLRYFDEAAWAHMYAWAGNQRSSVERKKYAGYVDELKKFIDYTVSSNVRWVKVSDVSHFEEAEMTYDGTMPETHTIVTNGIVSHNSDARFRMTSISVPHSGASGPVEEEDSLSGEGVDTYRYIRCFAFKNKLGGPQKYTCDLRLYVSDANGEAKGFDRVWDCYMYLKQTGQISGQRNKIKFGEGTPFAGSVLSWMELKALVDGDKDMITTICKKYKLPKPVRLYEWCRTQCMKGNGYELFMAWIKETKTKKAANAKAKAEKDSDDAE